MAGPVEDARKAYDQGDYALAVRLYERAAEQSPELREDTRFMSAWDKAEARIAYATGSLLHAEGEYEAAANEFMRSIGKDGDYELAYAALADAQRAGIRQLLVAALEAADGGDLLKAKQRLERSLVLGGGADEQVTAALNSIADPAKAFKPETLDQLAEARRLGDERQWALAERQLKAIVTEAPLLLPARAELTRTLRAKGMSVTMTDEAAALITQNRLSQALEKLASATTVWPYNDRAAELLGTVEARIKRAQAQVAEARQLADQKQWSQAYEQINAALEIDAVNAQAQVARSEIKAGYVDDLMGDAADAIATNHFAKAQSLIEQADTITPNSPVIKRQLRSFHATLAQGAYNDGRFGEALLRYQLAERYGARSEWSERLEKQFIDEADLSFVLDIPAYEPSLGVSSGNLATYLSAGRLARGPLVAAEDADSARYTVRVQIYHSDIELRQTSASTAGLSTTVYGDGGTVAYNNTHYWEKHGKVRAGVKIIDTQTGKTAKTWDAYRWATYTDQKQFIIGNTWQDSYWTLPTDQAIATRLAQDLAGQLDGDIEESVTLLRARELRDQAEALADDEPDKARDLRVRAVVLAGQVNERQAMQELHRMMRQVEKERPADPK